MKKNDKHRTPVLADHKKIGKRLVPPFLDTPSPLKETSWVRVTLPEIIWIACLNRQLGARRGTEVADALATATLKASPEHKKAFVAATDFATLSAEQRDCVLTNLNRDDYLPDLQEGLGILHSLYPKSPFGFLLSELKRSRHEPEPSLIPAFKSILEQLFDKTTREAIFMQATVVYLAFRSGKLFIQKGMKLGQLAALNEYPDTENSRMVAAAVRSAVPMLIFHQEHGYTSDWARYFWNRGLEIEPCSTD